MGPPESVSELYAGSYRRLVVQLYAVTGDLAEAEDAVQEAFVRVLCGRSPAAGLANPESWLRRVAVNVARSRYRRRRLLNVLLRSTAPPPAAPDPSPDHVLVIAALRRLPVGQRHALALHYLADLPVDEVARTLDVSVGTVKSRLARGRAALAALLTEPSVARPDGASIGHLGADHVDQTARS
jgi:RNA polymerase sigma-70 factor (ECF subfamily)